MAWLSHGAENVKEVPLAVAQLRERGVGDPAFEQFVQTGRGRSHERKEHGKRNSGKQRAFGARSAIEKELEQGRALEKTGTQQRREVLAVLLRFIPLPQPYGAHVLVQVTALG